MKYECKETNEEERKRESGEGDLYKAFIHTCFIWCMRPTFDLKKIKIIESFVYGLRLVLWKEIKFLMFHLLGAPCVVGEKNMFLNGLFIVSALCWGKNIKFLDVPFNECALCYG